MQVAVHGYRQAQSRRAPHATPKSPRRLLDTSVGDKSRFAGCLFPLWNDCHGDCPLFVTLLLLRLCSDGLRLLFSVRTVASQRFVLGLCETLPHPSTPKRPGLHHSDALLLLSQAPGGPLFRFVGSGWDLQLIKCFPSASPNGQRVLPELGGNTLMFLMSGVTIRGPAVLFQSLRMDFAVG